MNKFENGCIIVCRDDYVNQVPSPIPQNINNIAVTEAKDIPLIVLPQKLLDGACNKDISRPYIIKMAEKLAKKWTGLKKIYIAVHDRHLNNIDIAIVYQQTQKMVAEIAGLERYDAEIKKKIQKEIEIESWAFQHDLESAIHMKLITKFSDLSDKNFDNVIREAFRKGPPVSKLSLLKHRIMRLLGPVDNDLQALWDESERTGRKGFDPEKWREVVEVYKDYNWEGVLFETLRLIENCIGEIKGKKEAEDLKELVEKWNKDILQILSLLKKGKMDGVYEMLGREKGLNPIHKWFKELDDELEKLIGGENG